MRTSSCKCSLKSDSSFPVAIPRPSQCPTIQRFRKALQLRVTPSPLINDRGRAGSISKDGFEYGRRVFIVLVSLPDGRIFVRVPMLHSIAFLRAGRIRVVRRFNYRQPTGTD